MPCEACLGESRSPLLSEDSGFKETLELLAMQVLLVPLATEALDPGVVATGCRVEKVLPVALRGPQLATAWAMN